MTLGPGQCVVAPPGNEHRTCIDEEACIPRFEPAGMLNTGPNRYCRLGRVPTNRGLGDEHDRTVRAFPWPCRSGSEI